MAALIWSHFLFNNWFYSTFYSDGRPYLVALFIQQLVLFNFLFRWPPLFGRTFYSTTGFIQLFIPMAALIWSHFFWFYSTFYSDGRPYLVALFIQQLVLFNNLFYSTAYSLSLIPTVLFNSCSPDGRPLILFNFLFRWPPCTFY